MKKVFLTLALVGAINATNANTNELPTNEVKVSTAVGRYALTASTRNTYGQNYAVHVTVEGNQSSYGSTVYSAYVNNSSVSVSSVYGESRTYQFYYNGKTFYFRF